MLKRRPSFFFGMVVFLSFWLEAAAGLTADNIGETEHRAVPPPADRRRRKAAELSRAETERRPGAMSSSTGAAPPGTNPRSVVST